MDPKILVAAAAIAGTAGGLASIYMSLALRRAGDLVGDKGLVLTSTALTIYGIALLLESTVNLLAPAHLPPSPGRPQEILAVIVNRGTLIAIPLYTIAYSLMAASHYVSTLPATTQTRLYAAPLLLLLLIDYNIVDLIVLTIAASLVLGQYGAPRPQTITFYTIIAASHTTPTILLADPTAWWAIPLSTLLRATAPLLLLATARARKPWSANDTEAKQA